tara:strand:+ start:6761 stop:6994 length:234 start_codon:yes stop_codon:yes gene_type:complete
MKYDRVVWEIKRGDLVRLKNYPTGAEDNFIYTTGVVIGDIIFGEEQRHLWPSVPVYIFKTGIIQEYGPNGLEIISCS